MPPQPPRLRSTWARAVVPVAAGIGFFALLGLMLWGIAAFISSSDAETTDAFADRTFQPGSAERYASIVDDGGPILFPDLLGTDGDRSVVLHHEGDDPERGWTLFLAHPADRPLDCKVLQTPGTREFVDCDGRTIDVLDLARPEPGVGPVVSRDGVLTLDLVPDAAVLGTTP